MEERFPTKELSDLLRDYSMVEGVVQYVLIHADGHETSEHKLHQEAAIFTLKTIENRLSADGYHFPLTIEKEKMKETRVSIDEFLGPIFDPARQKLILKGRHSPYLNDYFHAGDEERPDNIVTIMRSGPFIVQGYAQGAGRSGTA